MKVQEKLKQFQLERKAILATNFYNYETLKGILEAASRVQAPVMLQLTKSSIDYMGLKRAVVLARQGLEDYGLTVAYTWITEVLSSWCNVASMPDSSR